MSYITHKNSGYNTQNVFGSSQYKVNVRGLRYFHDEIPGIEAFSGSFQVGML